MNMKRSIGQLESVDWMVIAGAAAAGYFLGGSLLWAAAAGAAAGGYLLTKPCCAGCASGAAGCAGSTGTSSPVPNPDAISGGALSQ